MTLPNFSYMMRIGQIRHVQAVFEKQEWRNPDVLVRHLLSPREKVECALRGWLGLRRLRSDPFYFYLLARTIYYDAVFAEAINQGAEFIANIGCGSDTRAYRWATELTHRGIEVVECDQELAIRAKQIAARNCFHTAHVTYLDVDLNSGDWANLTDWLQRRNSKKGLVMLEGVSPYVDSDQFQAFLKKLAENLNPSSILAYDYKIEGVGSNFDGGVLGRNKLRLPPDRDAVEVFHKNLGFHVVQMTRSEELTRKLPRTGASPSAESFNEDVLIKAALINGQSL